MHPADTPPIRTAPLALWRIAEAFLQMLCALFGGPDKIAEKHTLTAKDHGLIASWLRCGEAMLRRLLLIEAAAYPRPNTRPLLHVKRKRTRKLCSFWPEKPEEWRVHFDCLNAPRRRPIRAARAPAPSQPSEPVFVFREGRKPPPKALPRPRRARVRSARTPTKRLLRQDRLWVQHEPKIRFRDAWPLALRFEAMIRVLNDPTAYARRLARRLHATPHRVREILRAPADARHRVDRFEAMGEQGRAVWRSGSG